MAASEKLLAFMMKQEPLKTISADDYNVIFEAYKQLQEYEEADEDMRILPDFKQDMNNPLEPLKLMAALRSEYMKMELQPKKDVSPLTHAIIAALLDCLKRAAIEETDKGTLKEISKGLDELSEIEERL